MAVGAREAATYEAIPACFQGDMVPRYYGSWTFPLPTGTPGQQGWVRMILIEYVYGECMRDVMLHAQGLTRHGIDPAGLWDKHHPPKYRLPPAPRQAPRHTSTHHRGRYCHLVVFERQAASRALPIRISPIERY
ncbi:hypothetical protein VTI74DRAFT_11040 [Chaetomium olivicolor]